MFTLILAVIALSLASIACSLAGTSLWGVLRRPLAWAMLVGLVYLAVVVVALGVDAGWFHWWSLPILIGVVILERRLAKPTTKPDVPAGIRSRTVYPPLSASPQPK